MIHPVVIILVLALVAYDAYGPIVELPVGSWAAVWMQMGAYALIAAATHLILRAAGHALDRTGRFGALRLADAALSASRALLTLVFLIGVFAMDWLGEVRGAFGDWVGVDEIAALTPPLLVFAAGWWSFYPIERRLHDATILKSLDSGGPIHPMPPRSAYTFDKIRHTMLVALTPLLLILMWSESLLFAQERWSFLPWPGDDARVAVALGGLQLLGAVAVLALSPPLLLLLWDTAQLPSGPVRSRLEAMCRRHRVRCAGIRIWRTRGLVLNGAVVGVIPHLRFVLLTDALLERLPEHEVEAVMAHEIGHVRRRHMPWLILALAASLGLAATAVGKPIDWLAAGSDNGFGAWRPAVEAGAMALTIALGLLIFGYVSRLFERQADAFAVQHGSGLSRQNSGVGLTVTQEASDAMAGALRAVARLNHIPAGKFTWRHGSIAGRVAHIQSLVGRPVDRLPVDRAARRARVATILALLVVGAVTVVELDRWAQGRGGNGPLTTEPAGKAILRDDHAVHQDARDQERLPVPGRVRVAGVGAAR